MKKVLFVSALLCCLLLCACKKTELTWETVDDVIVTQYPAEDAQYTILFDVPADAVLEEENAEMTVYSQKDGDYEIVRRTFGCCDPEQVIQTLSGFSSQDVEVLRTSRYGMDVCRFVWCSAEEEGLTVSRADVIFDAPYSYALTFSAKEDAVSRYLTTQEQVFSSMSLFENEGF